jgi:hypothetical protein
MLSSTDGSTAWVGEGLSAWEEGSAMVALERPSNDKTTTAASSYDT